MKIELLKAASLLPRIQQTQVEKLLIYKCFQFQFTGQPPSLLFPSGSDIRRLSLDGNGTGSYSLVAHSQGAMGGLGVWWEKQLVFWTDLRQGTIKRARIPGGTAAKVINCGKLAIPPGYRLALSINVCAVLLLSTFRV